MSACMVDDSVINEIVSFLSVKATSRERRRWHVLDEYDLVNSDGCKRLAEAMFQLNVDAINWRYDGAAAQFRPLNFKYVPCTPKSPTATLKTLEYWLYQCTEGSVPERELYQTMTKTLSVLTCIIVEDSREYQEAPWG